jgi:hypothetical protein
MKKRYFFYHQQSKQIRIYSIILLAESVQWENWAMICLSKQHINQPIRYSLLGNFANLSSHFEVFCKSHHLLMIFIFIILMKIEHYHPALQMRKPTVIFCFVTRTINPNFLFFLSHSSLSKAIISPLYFHSKNLCAANSIVAFKLFMHESGHLENFVLSLWHFSSILE